MSTRSKPNRRKITPKYSFYQDGERHELTAKKYWLAIRAGWLIQSNYDDKIAFVSEKYRAIFNIGTKEWEFMITKVIKAHVDTVAAALMRAAVFAPPYNLWRTLTNCTQKHETSHPSVFILI